MLQISTLWVLQTGKTDIFELTKISDRLNQMFSNSILFMIAAVKTVGSFSISQKLFTHCTSAALQ